MIAYITGEVLEVNEDSLIVLAGGLGYQVYVPFGCFAARPAAGEQISLYTYMQLSTQLKAEGITLFGFADKKQLQLFELLLGVGSVGAKTALAALNCCGYGELVAAIQTGNVNVLTRVPRLGKKSAERILLELRDKVMKLEPEYAAPARRPANDMAANVRRTAVLALTQLGYAEKAAGQYVEAVCKELPADAALEDIITAALKYAVRDI